MRQIEDLCIFPSIRTGFLFCQFLSPTSAHNRRVLPSDALGGMFTLLILGGHKSPLHCVLLRALSVDSNLEMLTVKLPFKFYRHASQSKVFQGFSHTHCQLVDSNFARGFTVTTVTLTVVMKNYQPTVSCSLVLKINSILSERVTVLD